MNKLCNRSACRSPDDVTWWNQSTRAWYCSVCADLINNGRNGVGGTPWLCIPHTSLPLLMEDYSAVFASGRISGLNEALQVVKESRGFTKTITELIEKPA